MSAIASQITSLTVVFSTVYSDADQRKHQSSASLAFVQGIGRWPVNSPHKWPLTRKMFPFGDVIMIVAKAVIHISKNRKGFPRPGSWNVISVQADHRNVCSAIHITKCLMNPISHLYILLHRGFRPFVPEALVNEIERWWFSMLSHASKLYNENWLR